MIWRAITSPKTMRMIAPLETPPMSEMRTRQRLANLNSDNSDDSGDENGWTGKVEVPKPKKKKQKVVTDSKSINAQI